MVAGFPCTSVPCCSLFSLFQVTTAWRSLEKCPPPPDPQQCILHQLTGTLAPRPGAAAPRTCPWMGAGVLLIHPKSSTASLETFFFPWSFPARFASGGSFSCHRLLTGLCSARWQIGPNPLILGPSTRRGSARWQQHPRKMHADSSVPLLPDISRRAVPNVC